MGFWEIALIVLVLLIVLGPKRLPEVSVKAGQVFRKFSKMMHQFRRDLEK